MSDTSKWICALHYSCQYLLRSPSFLRCTMLNSVLLSAVLFAAPALASVLHNGRWLAVDFSQRRHRPRCRRSRCRHEPGCIPRTSGSNARERLRRSGAETAEPPIAFYTDPVAHLARTRFI